MVDMQTQGETSSSTKKEPVLKVLSQYISKINFHNKAVETLKEPIKEQPEINIHVDVRAKSSTKEVYIVELVLNIKTNLSKKEKNGDAQEELFVGDLIYSGVFQLQNIPKEHTDPFVLIECPRILFPFARRIVADVTRDAGFPPLMIDPINFAALYQQHIEKNKQANKNDFTNNINKPDYTNGTLQ